MIEEQLREAIRGKAVDGKVTCKAMLELAARMDCRPRKVGMLCNEMKIKITACQLGCFN